MNSQQELIDRVAYKGTQIAGDQLLKGAREARPHVRYAMHKDGHSIAAWSPALNRFQVIAAMAEVNGKEYWYNLPGDILINGERGYTDSDFEV